MNGKQLISIVILFSVSVSLTSVEAASASVSVVASNGQLTNGLCTSTTFLVMEYRELNGHGEAIVYVVDCFPIISLMECTGTRPDGINCELSGDSLTITSAGTILADFFTGEHFVGDALFLGPHAIAGVGMIKCPATNEGLPMLFVYLGQWTDTGGYAFARGGSCLTIPPFSGGWRLSADRARETSSGTSCVPRFFGRFRASSTHMVLKAFSFHQEACNASPMG